MSRLSSAGGNFLGDTALVENLETTKRTAAEIEQKVTEAKVTEKKINEARESYRPAAARASLVYFILNDFNKINPLYQFSLKVCTADTTFAKRIHTYVVMFSIPYNAEHLGTTVYMPKTGYHNTYRLFYNMQALNTLLG